MKRLIKNITLILENSEDIFNDPDYYYIPLTQTKISIAYIGHPRGYLYLGELIYLYKNNKWIAHCPKCGNLLYITGFGGSPLSGSDSAWGICGGCLEETYKIAPFTMYLHQYWNTICREKNKPINYYLLEKKLNLTTITKHNANPCSLDVFLELAEVKFKNIKR